uniref:C1q domain-containing protein n=1 Tax=Electrophorus electricus TaxID=8005 RepID=A0AAY5ER35_ELEEL
FPESFIHPLVLPCGTDSLVCIVFDISHQVHGRPGYQGPAGEPGVCAASCLPGSTGIPGAKGQKGDMGEIGQPGGLGIPGTKGDQGEQGVCNCKDGAKGIPGQPGISGPKGEKGVKGELGLTGIPGPCSPAIQSAFSAKLTNMYPAPDQPVPFTAVIYNIQFHYNPSSGVYRAHVNGTYVFSYQLVAYSKPLKVGLFLNFIPVVKSTEIVTLETASQQVVLHLYMGDQVWLQVKDQNNNGMYTGTDYLPCIFYTISDADPLKILPNRIMSPFG